MGRPGRTSAQAHAGRPGPVVIDIPKDVTAETAPFILGMVLQWQEIFYEGNYSAVKMTGLPDFVKLAEAYGATGLRATRPDELRSVLERGLNTPGVVVMDIVGAEEENVFPMVPSGAGLKEMRLR